MRYLALPLFLMLSASVLVPLVVLLAFMASVMVSAFALP
jgi:hypothetical protein